MFRTEREGDGNFGDEELEACTETTKKLAPEESREYFEYAGVASVKKEAEDVNTEEPGATWSCQIVKEELEDEISVHENEACLWGLETTSLCDGASVKQEDGLNDRSDHPSSGTEQGTRVYKCKDCSKSSKHSGLGSNTDTRPRQYGECEWKFECCTDAKKHPQQLCECVMSYGRYLYVDAGLYSILQGADNMDTGIPLSEINPQIIHISDKMCMEIDSQERKHKWYRQVAIEEKATMLQKKRDAARKRYRQMVGEEKVKFLQKKRDAIRSRYNKMTDEEKARVLQKLRDVRNDRYRQMSGEHKATILQKKREAARKRYRQMTGEEKVRFLQKKRDAVRKRTTQMVGDTKVHMLEKKRAAARNRYRKMGDEEKERFLQQKRSEVKSRYRQKQARRK